jgi:hypothetical protein
MPKPELRLCDAYLIAPDGYPHPFPSLTNEKGILFKAEERNVQFESWKRCLNTDVGLHSAPMHDTSGTPVCFFVVEHLAPNAERSVDGLVGILVPVGADKRRVADLLRARYGEATALLMSDEEWRQRENAAGGRCPPLFEPS